MALSADKTRKQITFNKDLLSKAEKQADKEERTLSGLIAVLLKDYLSKSSERA
jgi:hypothetical protein